MAPYLTLGVPEPFPAADTIDRYDIHYQIAEHPLVRRGHTLLDMGVGLGWTSLTFVRAVQTWLRPGGALALDEHVGNSRLARELAAEVHAWAEGEVLPRYRTLPPETLAKLPQEPHSVLEDSSVERVLPLVRQLFTVR